MISWVHAFIDRPADRFDEAAAFWTAVTGTELSARRGEHLEFATLLPPPGSDPYLKLQAVQDGAGAHLDLSVGDVPALVVRAVELGATAVADHGDYVVLRSPGGQLFCAVAWNGEANRPVPPANGAGVTARLDQFVIDVAPSAFGAEVAFWAALTSWESLRGALPEFHLLRPPSGLPLRILLQRLDEPRPLGAHLDLACSEIGAVRAFHEACGATVLDKRPLWTVMRDPAGGTYCLTVRDPHSGSLPSWALPRRG